MITYTYEVQSYIYRPSLLITVVTAWNDIIFPHGLVVSSTINKTHVITTQSWNEAIICKNFAYDEGCPLALYYGRPNFPSLKFEVTAISFMWQLCKMYVTNIISWRHSPRELNDAINTKIIIRCHGCHPGWTGKLLSSMAIHCHLPLETMWYPQN